MSRRPKNPCERLYSIFRSAGKKNKSPASRNSNLIILTTLFKMQVRRQSNYPTMPIPF